MGISSIEQKLVPLVTTMLFHNKIPVQQLKICEVEQILRAYIAYYGRDRTVTLLESLKPSDLSVFSWNELIRDSIRSGFFHDVPGLYRAMVRLGRAPDGHTFPYFLKACGEISATRLGSAGHGAVLVNGFSSNVFVCNAIVTMYGCFGSLKNAQKMFDEMCETGVCDIVSWNSIVAVHSQNDNPTKALEIFARMKKQVGLSPNGFTLVNVLSACGSVNNPILGRQVHSFAVQRGLCRDLFVCNAILDMYGKFKMMVEANWVFEKMEVKDVVTWNSIVSSYSQAGLFEDAISCFEKMRKEGIKVNVVTWSALISGFAQRGLGNEAMEVFRKMQSSGINPNFVTFMSLLSGIASVEAYLQGKEAHCYAIKRVLSLKSGKDLEEDLMIINGLIDMYSKCRHLKVARTMFDLIRSKERHVVTWTAMIGGYSQHGEPNEALSLFSEMAGPPNHKKPNTFTISCVLTACARLGDLRSGKEIHAYTIRNMYESKTLFVSNCLIDMYSKSGDVDIARNVFDEMPRRNLVSWTSLIAGYGMHGRGREALNAFDEMTRTGLVPDRVVFVVLLYACSHSGLIDEGMRCFNSIVSPGIEHYSCVVDLLGRSGRLREALEFIETMPIEPKPIIWYSLLSCCRLHSNIDIAERASNKLVEHESQNDGSFTILSNMYANIGQWKDVARIRSSMRNSGVKKRPGCSWVQGKEGAVTFFAGDRRHPRSDEIYDELKNLIERIRAIGYIPDQRFALHDVGEEEKDDLLLEHSEKLALSFGILTTTDGSHIRINKNLRVCGDCHTAMLYISKIVDREIILRDSSRFHHFKNGSCSCRGFW